ncbi:hypothetical protein L1987_08972 [Smallanthus sonchifolius]|uniref:Uncharacterized protein n=1 Tax=Smallanthus sonchifolius TaxID=185202 RepID=A0ACB9JP50_9ASTR|nr:hypothetical protein L1987_08972 [Smallanthus sonchifolius]
MLRACIIDFGGSWDSHLPLAEFSYNNSYHTTIGMPPFKMLYGRKCRTPVCWGEIGQKDFASLEVVKATSEKFDQIKARMKAVKDRQKSYADKIRRDLEFQVGDMVLLKILARVGQVAYRLDLPVELSGIHPTFHVSHLRKCLADDTAHVPYDEIEVDNSLNYIEEPIAIIDRADKRLRNKSIQLVKEPGIAYLPSTQEGLPAYLPSTQEEDPAYLPSAQEGPSAHLSSAHEYGPAHLACAQAADWLSKVRQPREAYQVYDTERVIGKSPPMLKSISEFSNWKIMMKAYFKFTEHTLWESIVKGPHIPKTANADGALGSIILALPTKLYLNFEQHETAQGLWNALCLRFEGNAALQESRTNLLLNQYNMLRKIRVKFEEYELGKKLLDSLPDCWTIPCMLIKNTTPYLKSKTLDDIICLLESYELDAKKRELNNKDEQNNSSSTNAALFSGSSEGISGTKPEKNKGCCEHSSSGKVKSSGQIPENQITLFGAFMSSYDALVTGKLQPAVHNVEDLVQINPDDLEYMDLQCQRRLQLHSCPKQLSNCEWEDEIEDDEDEMDEAFMAEIEDSMKPADITSDCALKTDSKGKGKAHVSDETSSENEVNSKNKFDICSSLCVDRMQNYHAANTFLIVENDKLKRVNKELKQQEVNFTRKIKALLKDNVTFKEYLDKKDVLIKDLSEKLIKSETDLIKERVIVSKWKMQQNVFDECVSKQRTVYIKDELGYNKIPQPENFVPFPEPHESNKLMNVENSNFHDMYISADINSECVDDENELDGVKIFQLSINSALGSLLWTVNTCSTNGCVEFDCVSEVSSTSTFFDKVVHTARDYVPFNKLLVGDVVLDEFGNPLIQEYDLSSERPKKNNVIAPENHILTSETENNKVVKVKVSVPTNVQRKSWCVKGKSIDVKDKFIDVKDKSIQIKKKLGKKSCGITSEVGECSKSKSKPKSYNCFVCGQVGHFVRNYKHNSSKSRFTKNKAKVKSNIIRHFKQASENDSVSESGVIQRYSRDYLLSRNCHALYSNVCRDYVLPKFEDKRVPKVKNEQFSHMVGLKKNIKLIKLKEQDVKDVKTVKGKSQPRSKMIWKKGVTHQYSAARTPQQNGVAERKNKTLIEAARTMLVDSKLPIIFWAEAVNIACYVLKRVLMVKQLTKTLYELFYKRKPYIKFFRAFGCSCTLLNTQDSLPKFAAIGDECYFLGYCSYQKAYRVYNKRTKIVQESFYVEWQELNTPTNQNGPDWFFDA